VQDISRSTHSGSVASRVYQVASEASSLTFIPIRSSRAGLFAALPLPWQVPVADPSLASKIFVECSFFSFRCSWCLYAFLGLLGSAEDGTPFP